MHKKHLKTNKNLEFFIKVYLIIYSKIPQTKRPNKSNSSQCRNFFEATGEVEYSFMKCTSSI